MSLQGSPPAGGRQSNPRFAYTSKTNIMRPELPSQFNPEINPEIKTDTLDNESEINPDILERRLEMVNNLDQYITSHEKFEQKDRVLREKQMAVFIDIRNFLKEGGNEGYVEAPTGFGKTILFLEIVKAIDQKTLIVVPSRILIDQAYERFKQFNPDSDVGRVSSDYKELGKKVTITTYKSLTLPNNGINPQDFDLLILDEVHRSLTEQRFDAVGKFRNAVKFGFTATPEYTKDKRVEKLLNNEIHNITLKEAVETGLLSSFSVYLAETEVDLSKVSITNNGDYNPKELEKAIDIESRNMSAVELYQQLVEKNLDLSKAVVNCVSVKHAKEVAHIFQKAGIGAEAIYGTQDQKERDSIIKRYKEGQLQILTNVNVLTEGFDVPDASLAINLRPTLSKVMAKQRGGRILRLNPENSAKHAVIVDYLDRNENKRNFQVTFAQVAEGAQILNPAESDRKRQEEKERPEKEPKEPRETKDKLQLQIKGLNVITSTQEVLKVVKELEIKKNEVFSPITETDLAISEHSLRPIFIGAYEMLKPIISEVLEDLKKENPNNVQVKKNESSYSTIVTDKNLFIEKMLAKGVKLKQPLKNIQEEDFSTTGANILNFFVGARENVVSIAQGVLKELKASNPDIFDQRKTKKGYIQVITNTDLFFQAMLKKGIKFRDPELKIIKDNEIANSNLSLTRVFMGDRYKVKTVANQIIEEIKVNNPNLIEERITGRGQKVIVVTDRDFFIQLMLEKGITLRDKFISIQDIQPTDFCISTRSLDDFFVGGKEAKVRDIVRLFKKDNPNLITKRKNLRNKGVIVEVVTNKEEFIKEMQKKGIKIRTNTTIDTSL